MSLIKRINTNGNAAPVGLRLEGNLLLVVPEKEATKRGEDKAVRKRTRSKP